MKNIIFVQVLLILIITPISAQKKTYLNEPTHDDRPVHFGFCLGLNVMDFVIHSKQPDISNNFLTPSLNVPVPGFHIQIITNYRLAENLDARFLPGISFGQRDIFFYDQAGKLANDKHRLESNYLEFPFLLKYKAKRTSNFRPYMISGLNLRADIAKTYSDEDEVYLDLNLFDVCFEIGAGIDFYLPYFKFSTELKFSYGFLDDLKRRDFDATVSTNHSEFQNSIERLNSTMVMLSFHFE